ncbi:MAG: MoxR family ATPase, partial [Leifsonia sp.]
PKTQSALLEVMEEGRVTHDGISHPVGPPFMVVATQNPIEQAGTYRLPEAQLDRFLMKTSIGYPDHDSTVRLLGDAAIRDRAATVQPLISTRAVVDMAQLASSVHVDPAVLGYVSHIADETRRASEVKLGLSTRGCLSFVRVAKTWAAANGRPYVLPDDVKALAVPVLSHRLILEPEAEFTGTTVGAIIARVLAEVAPPVASAR